MPKSDPRDDHSRSAANHVAPKARPDNTELSANELDHLADEFERRSPSRSGPGVTALFAGAKGTGKTQAAEALANRLGLKVFRIDLSAVAGKYIGETEKNLRRLFDEAEQTGALILIDEADALFRKRSEVRDSHDRYANIEVSYILERLENYSGVSVLSTNRKESIDAAFLRRLRFIVDFPRPAGFGKV